MKSVCLWGSIAVFGMVPLCMGQLYEPPFEQVSHLIPDSAYTFHAWADCAGDARMDLFAGDAGDTTPDSFWVAEGDSFTQTWTSPENVDTRAATTADFDGDGRVDLLTAGAGRVPTLWLGQGDGTFQGGAVVTAPLLDVRVAIAVDLDSDGDPDAVLGTVPSGRDGGIVLLRNDGTGALSAWGGTLGTNGARALWASDVDWDGDRDLVAAGDGGGQVWLNDGQGTMTAGGVFAAGNGVSFLDLGDVNRDGAPDMVVAGTTGAMQLWYGDSAGGFTAGEEVGTAIQRTAVLIDADLDGDLDIVSGQQDGTCQLWLNNGARGFSASQVTWQIPGSPRAATALDVDMDGDPDVAFAGEPGGVSIVLNRRQHQNATFPERIVLSPLYQPPMVVSADMDRDGDLDIITGTGGYSTSSILWYPNEGQGTFGTPVTVAIECAPSLLAPADMDGDGDLDIYMATRTFFRLTWYENPGNARRDNWLRHDIADVRYAISVPPMDVDGDGDLDAIGTRVNYGDPDVISWYENAGAKDGTLWQQHIICDNADLRQLAAADVNGDGFDDLLPISNDSTVVTTWLEHPGKTGRDAWQVHEILEEDGTPFSLTSILTPADINGDGHVDLVGRRATHQPEGYTWTRTGWVESDGTPEDGGWVFHELDIGINESSGFLVCDLDADGDNDILGTEWEWEPDSNLEITHIVWAEQIVAATRSGVAWRYHRELLGFDRYTPLHAADLNRDGSLDLLACTTDYAAPGGNGNLFWFPNNPYHASLSVEPREFPQTIVPYGGEEAAWRVDVTNAGRDGDADLVLNRLELVLSEHDRFGWTPAQFAALVAAFRLYRDDGNGHFEPTRDTLLREYPDLQFDAGGTLVLDVSGTGAPVLVAPDTTVQFHVTVVMQPGGFPVSHSQFSALLCLTSAGLVALSDGQGPIDLATTGDSETHIHASNDVVESFSNTPYESAGDHIIGYGGEISAADTADMNGDGALDVIAAGDDFEYDIGGITTALDLIGWIPDIGEPQFTFDIERFIVFGLGEDADADRVTSLAVADFDLDGDPDVAASIAGAGKVLVFLNARHSRGFQTDPWPFVEIDGDFPSPERLRTVDFDRDGDADLVAVSSDPTVGLVWLENGRQFPGTWTRHVLPTARDVADARGYDMDRDGDVDVVLADAAAGTVAWMERTQPGDGWVEHVVAEGYDGVSGVDAGDVDGDGDIDVAAASPDLGDVVWFLNDGTARGWRSQVIDGDTPDAAELRLVNRDRDWDLDLIIMVNGDDQGVRLVDNKLSHRSAVFSGSDQLGTPVGAVTAVTCGDIDRDGDCDVAAVEQSGRDTAELVWWENTPSGTFQRRTVGSVDPTDALHMADVDLNGIPNLLVVSADAGTATSWERADGVWASTALADDAAGAQSPTWVDVDADGDLDILACLPARDTVCWWDNPRGPGLWQRKVIDDTATDILQAVVYDAGFDGDTDILGISSGEGYLYLWEAQQGNGRVAWTRQTLGEVSGAYTFGLIEPLNAEGPQLLVASEDDDGTEQLHLWQEVYEWHEVPDEGWVFGPNGWQGRHVWSGTRPSVHHMLPVDLDRDGHLELLAAASDVSGLRWFDREGTSSRFYGVGGDSAQRDVCGGDFDKDGDMDVVTASADGSELLLWPNTGGHYSVTGWTPAPVVMDQNTDYGAFAVRLTNNGKGGDPDHQLVHLQIALLDAADNPLTSEIANRIFDWLAICRDNGNGEFDADGDTILHMVDDIVLVDGTIEFDFPDYDPGVQIPGNQSATFLVAVRTSDAAGNAEPRAFRVRCVVEDLTGRFSPTRAQERDLHLPLVRDPGGNPTSGVILLAGDHGPTVQIEEPSADPVAPAPSTRFAFSGVTQPYDTPVASVAYELTGPTFAQGQATGTVSWSTPVLSFGEGVGDFWAVARDDDGDIGYDHIHLFTRPRVSFQSRASVCYESTYHQSVQVRLSRAVDQRVTVTVDIGGTATGEQVDYRCEPSPVVFEPWHTVRSFSCYFYDDYGDDQEVEREETVIFTLKDAVNAVIGDPRQHVIYLRDEDYDHDMFSDDWEDIEHGGTDNIDGREDTDGDGMSNGWEWLHNQDLDRYLLGFPPGWTLFSVGAPVVGFPVARDGDIPGPLWTWEDAQYKPAEDLSSHGGFWALNRSGGTVEVEFEPALTRVDPGTLTLTPGWNLVSIATAPEDNSITAIFGDWLSEIPGGVWEWVGRVYCQATEIHPLKAYWVYLDSKRTRQIDLPAGADQADP